MLNVATHAYAYPGGLQERDAARAQCAADPEWSEYLKEARPSVVSQTSSLYTEAPFVAELEGVHGMSSAFPFADADGGAIFELRRYQLQLGYDTVPRFFDLYRAGLPSKLEADGTDPSTSLCTVMATEVGMLNEVIEVWRHGGSAAMERSRAGARSAEEWKASIGQIARLAISFRTTTFVPTAFSPWK
jgi:hypothetical protein